MLDHMSRRSRSLLCLCLTALALVLSVLAFCTSYWCEGTHKVVKPLCLSAVKMHRCGQNDSQPSTTVHSETPTQEDSGVSNTTLSPRQSEELDKIKQRRLANAVQYVWETGEDKYTFRYFHTGFWESCEKHIDGERCRRFLDLTPEETHGVLWLSMVSEFTYISLLGTGFLLVWLDVLCSHKETHALKINAFAALCFALSGLIGMVAHMMYTTVFQLMVILGPKDWRPQTWDYGWSFISAWVSFGCCMSAAVLTLNSYTKTLIELRRRRLRCQDRTMDSIWAEHGTMGVGGVGEVPTLVLVGGCRPQECEDCEMEMDEIEQAVKRSDLPF